jgi:hypothetical protein
LGLGINGALQFDWLDAIVVFGGEDNGATDVLVVLDVAMLVVVLFASRMVVVELLVDGTVEFTSKLVVEDEVEDVLDDETVVFAVVVDALIVFDRVPFSCEAPAILVE